MGVGWAASVNVHVRISLTLHDTLADDAWCIKVRISFSGSCLNNICEMLIDLSVMSYTILWLSTFSIDAVVETELNGMSVLLTC